MLQNRDKKMNLSAPTKTIFIISIALAILAVGGKFVNIPVVTDNTFWTMTLAFVMLTIGNLLKGV
jgi:uncharacterized membrane protein